MEPHREALSQNWPALAKATSTRSLLTLTWPREKGPWAWNTSYREIKSPHSLGWAYLASVGMSCPVSCSVCTPLFCSEQALKVLSQAPSFLCFRSVGRGWVLLPQRKVGCEQLHHLHQLLSGSSGCRDPGIAGAGWILCTLFLLLL